MLNVKIGDKLSRITPPSDGDLGYCQSGKVVSVTADHVVVSILCDGYRNMEFSRKDGMDTSGLGCFVVKPDFLN